MKYLCRAGFGVLALLIYIHCPALSAQAYDSSVQATGTELHLVRVTPSGEDVPAERQIVFQFDRKVVPVGRMDRKASEIPISIKPALNCEWRWLNTSALACQLRDEDKLRPATRYDIQVRPGIRSEDGATLRAATHFEFITARPRVTYTRFVNWLAPGKPLLQVTFNQAVTRSSVIASLYMAPRDGEGDSSKLQIYPDELARNLPAWAQFLGLSAPGKPDDRATRVDGEEARRVWLVQPVKDLGLDTHMELNVQPGLNSAAGPEPGVEMRTVVSFDTFPAFRFIGVRCTDAESRKWTLLPAEALSQTRAVSDIAAYDGIRCSPLQGVALVFSTPVRNSMVRDQVRLTPPLNGGRKDYDPWANVSDQTGLAYPHRQGREYTVWLPEYLRAYKRYDVQLVLDRLTDEFGRKLSGQDQFRFFTAHRDPNLELNTPYAVLEKNLNTDIALYVTNLENIGIRYDKITADDSHISMADNLKVPAAKDVAFAMPLQARHLLQDSSGVISGSLSAQPRPPELYRDPNFFVQVTPFQVHAKLGHFNSLVWVTDLGSGQPVPDAKITLYRGTYSGISDLEKIGVDGSTDRSGIAHLAGISQFDPELEIFKYWMRESDPRYFLRVQKGKDMALLPLDDHFRVNSEGAWSQLRRRHGHAQAWGTTAQGVYKLGDTIQYKIYVRGQSNRHWVAAKRGGYSLKVYDPQSKVVYEQSDIQLSRFGALDGSFKVPEQGAVGWYRFELKADDDKLRWQPLTVLVSDFTPSPFKVRTELNGERFMGGDTVAISTSAELHSGGPYADARLRLSARLTTQGYQTSNPQARDFSFGGSSGKYLDQNQSNLLSRQTKLTDAGQYQDALSLPLADIYYGTLQVESDVMDDRGKYVASLARATYVGRDRFVGLRNTKWVYHTGKPARIEALVVDDKDKLASGVDIHVAIERQVYKAARVKGPGNAYLTNNIVSWDPVDECNIKSALQAVRCSFTPSAAGYYRFVATIKDSKGREHKTVLDGWVAGDGFVVWDTNNDATLQIVPEQNDYKVGASARYLIKNPFPGARALISIERYGVLDSWVQELKGSTPIIEFPIKPDYLPGFYLSVTVVSPRVAKPLGPGNVDLGKPTYRMGYIAANVSDPYKQLQVSVKTAREVYKPRDTVQATIHVASAHNSRHEPYEIAVAVVDESVLALNQQGKRYYDPYRGFNRLDSLDLNNYSLISRLVGRQKFEKKGANTGGDGGGSAYAAIRNLFKFVSYWNPSLKPDRDGNVSISFTAPDNLTGWRVLAWAVTPDDMMGLGDANFKVNRPTEVRPVMPNQVIEGDAFEAGFSVMNRSDKPRTLNVSINVAGPLAKNSRHSLSKRVKLGPYKKARIWLPLKTRGYGLLRFVARAGDSSDADGMEHVVPVNKRRSLETAATYGTTTRDRVTESIHIPEAIYTDVGSVSVVMSPSVIGNLDGAFRYIRDYPYYCWEQRITKAVMAASFLQLKDYLDKQIQWDGARDEVNAQLQASANFQAPNGGMAYWIPNNQYVSPYLSAYTAIAFNWLRRDGYEIPTAVESKLLDYLQEFIRKDDYPSFYSKGMASSVRAVALAALAESGRLSRDDIERYAGQIPLMDLFGRAHLLQAALKVGNEQPVVNRIIATILAQSSQSGGKFQFNEPWDDSYTYILATPLRSNCAVLSGLLAAQQQADANKRIGDIPFKLVRSITQSRGNRDHWENTQENVFCMAALSEYARRYEAQDPNYTVAAQFAKESLGSASFRHKSDPMLELKRPIRDGDAGRKAQLVLNKQGPGRLYYSARLAYDLKSDNPARVNAGIEIRREYSIRRDNKWTLLKSPMQIRRGDVVRVDLFVSLPTARHFVVVNDPVPGGLETVNSDLATASTLDAEAGKFQASKESWWFHFSNWSDYGRYFWSFYHKELRHDSARFYADYLPAGNYHLSYTAQAIAVGEFVVMPVSAEEMYDPDVYGKGLTARLHVVEAD